MTPYYYVYRVGYGKPTIKHATIGITRAVTPQTFWLDGVIPPQNFDRPRGRPGVAFNG